MADEEKESAQDAAEGEPVSRRGFLRSMMWASAGLVALETALAGLAMFWPRKVEGFGSRIVAGKVSDFPPMSVTKIRSGKFYISVLENSFIALYWRCVHLGCTVPWVPGEGHFHCPCHGSIYDRMGQNLAGPAPRPLDYMTSVIDGDKIVVDTGQIHERDRALPEHMTKLPV